MHKFANCPKAGNTRPASPADLTKKVEHILAGVLKYEVLPTDFNVNKVKSTSVISYLVKSMQF